MKTVSNLEIKQIECEINEYNIQYEDIIAEVTDHIICEIEYEMNQHNLDFDNAFILVFNKWRPMLRPNLSSKYNDIPSFISNSWTEKDSARWKIAGALTALFGLFYFGISYWTRYDLLLFAVVLLGITVLLSFNMFRFLKKTQNYRSFYLKTLSKKQSINVLVFMGLTIYELSRYIRKPNTDFATLIIGLIAIYTFTNTVLIYRESLKLIKD
ncbi:hypothetical protein [Myroides odoratimimus]|uniref:Uncharacterized protein n=1 Tax=Myroides odoratimimus CIP 101113 TaxID=883154 RepID=A0AAV3F0H6_9FLAO|nr:hypothetical protein [Myroides odoratimimus]EHO08073.1 hypothetical protein HMPREF9715_02703 [Myroides odoratimimus CIP 101113]